MRGCAFMVLSRIWAQLVEIDRDETIRNLLESKESRRDIGLRDVSIV